MAENISSRQEPPSSQDLEQLAAAAELRIQDEIKREEMLAAVNEYFSDEETYKQLLRIATKRTSYSGAGMHTPEDIVMATWVSLTENFRKRNFKENPLIQPLDNYIKQSVRYKALDALRQKKKESITDSIESADETTTGTTISWLDTLSSGEHVEHTFLQQEELMTLAQVITQLSPEQKIVYVLVECMELKMKEVLAFFSTNLPELSINEGMLKSRLYRARQEVAKLYPQYVSLHITHSVSALDTKFIDHIISEYLSNELEKAQTELDLEEEKQKHDRSTVSYVELRRGVLKTFVSKEQQEQLDILDAHITDEAIYKRFLNFARYRLEHYAAVGVSAEDLVQAAYVKVFERTLHASSETPEIRHMYNYMIRTISTLVTTLYREADKLFGIEAVSGHEALYSRKNFNPIERKALQQAEKRIVFTALTELPLRQRRLLIMKYIVGLSVPHMYEVFKREELAEPDAEPLFISLTEEAIKAAIDRAKKALVRKLEPHLDELTEFFVITRPNTETDDSGFLNDLPTWMQGLDPKILASLQEMQNADQTW